MSPAEAIDAAKEAIVYVRSHYDESIFPPRPPGPHTEVYDGEAAAVARLTCDNIARELSERLIELAGRVEVSQTHQAGEMK